MDLDVQNSDHNFLSHWRPDLTGGENHDAIARWSVCAVLNPALKPHPRGELARVAKFIA
jgi:hypothetical protein